MPLSDEEQKILEDIESNFYETDPGLAREVATTTVYTRHIRNLRWTIFAFIAGLLIMIFTLSVHFLLAATGFLVMLVALLSFEHNLRALGKITLEQQAQKRHRSNLRNVFGMGGSNLKDRFNKDN